jgi:hypothetical protein
MYGTGQTGNANLKNSQQYLQKRVALEQRPEPLGGGLVSRGLMK